MVNRDIQKKFIMKNLLLISITVLMMSSCVSTSMTMREPNARVEFIKSDFTFSEQVTGESKVVKVFGIDWKRLFRAKSASVTGGGGGLAGISIANIPIIGSFVDKSSSYALYDMMFKNPGYDVVFYPRFETVKKNPFLGIVVTTKVKATARLAKIKD